MNYELAKKLKDAGFPQKKNPLVYVKIEAKKIHDKKKDLWYTRKEEIKLIYTKNAIVAFPKNEWWYCPTLSELIEACGYGFRQLTRHTDYNHPEKSDGLTGRIWMAKAGKESGNFLVSGHTAEEAVAKLWIKLNKKQCHQ